MAQWVNVPEVIPGTHMVEEQINSSCLLTSSWEARHLYAFYVYTHHTHIQQIQTHVNAYIHTHTNRCINIQQIHTNSEHPPRNHKYDQMVEVCS